MKRSQSLLAIGLLAYAVQAKADGWIQDQINNIVTQVQDVWNTVTGDVKQTAADLKRQLNTLTLQGDTVKEDVKDAFNLIVHRRGPLLNKGVRKTCREGYRVNLRFRGHVPSQHRAMQPNRE